MRQSTPNPGNCWNAAPIPESGALFGDESHILYVNGEYRGDDAVGRLMHDFHCADPQGMYYPVLADRTRYFKEDEKGVSSMCRISEEWYEEGREDGREEGREEAKSQNARSLLKLGKLSHEEIAAAIGLPVEKVRELDTGKSA